MLTFHLKWFSFAFYCQHLGVSLGEHYYRLDLSASESSEHREAQYRMKAAGGTVIMNQRRASLSNFMVCLCFSQSIRALDYANAYGKQYASFKINES